jgi:pyrimidine oxygenase
MKLTLGQDMTKHLELGIFIPIANNGWMVSRTAPQYMPTFDLNRRICQLGEQIGFDFVFSMSKWRGFGGDTHFWDYSLESLTLMAALAAVTQKVRIYASVQPLLVPPAVAAKMAATIDDISGGRFGLNIVTGTNPDEAAQMGLLPDDYDSYRYEYAAEWLELVRRLWTEESVTHKGKHFHLEDCRSDPKPLRKPHPDIVCAGISETGIRFTARHGTHAFLGGRTPDELLVLNNRMKELAREAGRAVKTYTVVTLIQGRSDAHARELLDYYQSGADTEALRNIIAMVNGTTGELVQDIAKKFVIFGPQPLVGGPETVASVVNSLAQEGGFEGLMFCFPDFVKGLNDFQAQVAPILREKYHIR